ncbi:DUF4255 domain-containing protein [Pseudomonas chlororaphis]|uniref:Pvc16 N-terminal domain-containing protein n=1 Tax=Pseudomonas chlororaphis TaxID=587753 RepID=A0AAX3FQ88_9PSED|nr:DUF4255 domain-containing protein [Pseudomonas chlororaphis]AZC38219.1 hypothetical protein C4K37_3834 [Pseudomonas chlororaphis subsp. piscium]AZC44767.1 hypothetical protein C4K36_3844 [Pseudomonas chlororaphis subsp. piscium]WDG70372.1 DUF4255 domain-containing protein [Pseudomonas chlororaphis]WDH31841.1 DUF4255 domain-containing protein [Pseudomonas chlororaphis]WDH68898.1 DUF4255 domain-containing protein [Pseudomonas chlororaphis]
MADLQDDLSPKRIADSTLIQVNQTIGAMLAEYLPEGVDVVFTLPDTSEQSTPPTVSVFLYDVHEDLSLRTGVARQFSPSNGMLMPGSINVCCRYLITYWEMKASSSSDSPATMADSQAVLIMNDVLNALINARTYPGLSDFYGRVIPPSEQLNSLGNFWQSLGNKPRLCLTYEVTVPIALTRRSPVLVPVKAVSAAVAQKPGIDFYRQAGTVVWEALVAALDTKSPLDDAARAQLKKVTVTCVGTPFTDDKLPDQHLDITLSGVVLDANLAAIQGIADSWKTQAIGELTGFRLFIDNVVNKLVVVS